ncbi:hypothetical protein GCM10010172_80110 [Paractinoplanes ferrugineus]|uniref:Uncharacterized protein n=1 Tax=Paractinoplanes ferrugineus TaxID=113564 RepID=A0A919MQV7_9ACTN|nr:hypothetical protein [Actinoplanes ferrugineus]GIE16727.1 hypothetical protein Afe05nite_85670 [Actinoplanes ferrugineus]
MNASVWVVTRHEVEFHESEVIAVSASLDSAMQACDDNYGAAWPQLEWVQQADGSWTTYVKAGLPRYTADPWEVTP